jgi:hypothetical protein
MFYIEIVGQGPLLDKTGQPFAWDHGADAKEEATLLNNAAKEVGELVRYRVKRDASDLPRDPDWRVRELKRFKDGTYQHVPWQLERCLKAVYEHFVHLSLDQPGCVAYMPSVERGEQDRPERMTAGRYLTKYFGGVLSPNSIRYWSNKVFVFTKKFEIKFAKTSNEIYKVYNEGPHTCVPASQARAYGAGDLAVAYIEDDGVIVCRSICWPEKERFGRIYPEDQGRYWQEMKQQLEAKGWKYYKPDEFGLYYGARLLTKVAMGDGSPKNNGLGGYVDNGLDNLFYTCPHLDHAYYVKPIDDKHLIICKDQGLNARTCGNGYAHGFKCDECGDYGCAQYKRGRMHGGQDHISGGVFTRDKKRLCPACVAKTKEKVHKQDQDVGGAGDWIVEFVDPAQPAPIRIDEGRIIMRGNGR